MARPRGFQHRSRSPRRSTTWGFGPDAVLSSSGATPSLLFTTGIVLVVQNKATIVRLRGSAMVHLTAAGSAGDGYTGAFGIGLVSAEAFAAGAGSVPGALTDSDDDIWLYHQFFEVKSATAMLADGVNAQSIAQRFEVDSKAMRKLTIDQVVFGSFEAFETGVAVVQFVFDSRMLVKMT